MIVGTPGLSNSYYFFNRNTQLNRGMKSNTLQAIVLELPSRPASISMIESWVTRMVERYRISPDVHGNILVSVTEAVNNAIIHGNNGDESKVVQVHLKKQNDQIAVRVSDQGCGFDHCKLPDPTAPENILTLGGRGVFLMKRLCDDISFEDNGRTVEMHFKI